MTVTVAVDVGATSLKWRRFDDAGHALGLRRRRPTPSPCSPDALVALLVARAGGADALAVGFPGTVHDGVVLDPANLARRGGPGSQDEPAIRTAWQNFDLAGALRAVLDPTAVVVLNDADAAALGCAGRDGRQLVITLGTGFGVSLVADGALQEIPDVGGSLRDGASFDECFGEAARRRDELTWRREIPPAVSELAARFDTPIVHLAGGNARRLSPTLFSPVTVDVVIERDDPALRGLWRAARAWNAGDSVGL